MDRKVPKASGEKKEILARLARQARKGYKDLKEILEQKVTLV